MSGTPDHWDPPQTERQYYRSSDTGDLGWLVRRDGKDRIRLDRPMQEIVKPFDEGKWVEEREWKPFSRTQVQKLLFELDKQMCFLLSLYKEAKKDWLSLKDEERIEWMKNGPGPGNLRAEVYKAVFKILERHSR